jgi:hypothetical protein
LRKSELSRVHETDELNEYRFEAAMVVARTTDLGLGGGPFLVVVVAVTNGYCNCCHEGRVGVIDLAKNQVAWSADTDRAVGPYWIDAGSEQLRLFHLFPDDAPLTLAVTSSSSCGGGAGGEQGETWYRPSRNSAGDIQFVTVWKGRLQYGWSGNRGGRWAEGCAQIRSLWPRRAYQYVVHDLAGWIDVNATARDPFIAIERPCSTANDHFGAVDFISTSVVTPSVITPGQWDAAVGSDVAPTLERRDLRPTVTFPFNLPVRRLLLDVHRVDAAATSKHLPEAQAPNSTLVAGFPKKFKWQDRKVLEIRRASDSVVLRQVPDPSWVDERRPNEYGDYSFPSVGWSRDGRRCLAIVEIGLGYGPVLVSLTADGKDDAWEGLLPRDHANLGDGFILDLPEPSLKPRDLPAKH